VTNATDAAVCSGDRNLRRGSAATGDLRPVRREPELHEAGDGDRRDDVAYVIS
jgi:hypothetical protein